MVPQKYVKYNIQEEPSINITIRFRWFYMPFINRSKDVKVLLHEIHDREIYVNHKFNKYIEDNKLVNSPEKEFIKEQLEQQYATQRDIEFVEDFTDAFIDFYKSYTFKPIIVNNAIFINQPIEESYFISNIDKKLRELGFGTNIIYYAKGQLYIIRKVVTYWLANVERLYSPPPGCRGDIERIFLDKNNKVDISKLCSSNLPLQKRRGGRARVIKERMRKTNRKTNRKSNRKTNKIKSNRKTNKIKSNRKTNKIKSNRKYKRIYK
jgi:hypothetical protein